MANKNPTPHNTKKVGKTLKEKRLAKKTKHDTKTGLLPESH
jgi:hypothetical protein